MDLVEIRKKANNKKKKPAKKKDPVIEESSVQQEDVQGENPARDAQTVDPERKQNEAAAVEAEFQEGHAEVAAEEEQQAATSRQVDESVSEKEKDPLDALFSFRQEMDLSVSENYLQALVADDEIVDSNIEQWLTFSLGEEEYALSIDSVSEIIKPREVTDIPRVPDFISGIISLRGIIVPIFDLNKRLNLGSSELSSASRIIVCNDGERLAGFMVDRINQVVNVPINNIEPPPTVLSGMDRDFVEGVGRVDGRMLILLHLSNVINAELV